MGFPLTPPFSDGQQTALSVLTKTSSILSILGSFYILQDILRFNNKKRLYHRIMLVRSMMDIIFSVRTFLSTWLLPVGVHPAAIGNMQSCEAMGFLGQGSLMSAVLYNGSLTLFFLMTICYGWKEVETRTRRLEYFLHLVPLTVAWSTAAAGIPLKLYNPQGYACWISPSPMGCKQSWKYGPEEANCERGDNASVYRWAFAYAIIFFLMFLQAIAMFIIYRRVLGQEKSLDRYSFAGHNSSAVNREQSRECAHQAIAYIMVFFVTFIFNVVWYVIQQETGKVYTILVLLASLFLPLQGFFDFFIYIRPKYIKRQLKNTKSTRSTHLDSELTSQQPKQFIIDNES